MPVVPMKKQNEANKDLEDEFYRVFTPHRFFFLCAADLLP